MRLLVFSHSTALHKHFFDVSAHKSASVIPITISRYFLPETDGNNATYFIGYQLDAIARALRMLDVYLTKKAKEIEKLLDTSGKYNIRQMALLSHAVRNSHSEFTIKFYRSIKKGSRLLASP